MTNPITKIAFLIIVVAVATAFFKSNVSFEKFEVMVQAMMFMFFAMIVRAETLGTVFVNLSDAIKQKWSK